MFNNSIQTDIKSVKIATEGGSTFISAEMDGEINVIEEVGGNLWRMHHFYLAYQKDEKLAPLVQDIRWTAEACPAGPER